MIDLGTRDLVLPSLLHDVIISALHGEHHGTGVFVDPLFQPPQGEDSRVMRTGNSEGYDALRPEVCDLCHSLAAPFASHPDTHSARGRRNRGGNNGVGLREPLADTRKLPRELTDIINSLEPAALIVTALDVNIVNAVHRFLPPFPAVGDEVDVRIMDRACGKNGHGMSHCHEIFCKQRRSRQGIILRRNGVVVNEPDIHGSIPLFPGSKEQRFALCL